MKGVPVPKKTQIFKNNLKIFNSNWQQIWFMMEEIPHTIGRYIFPLKR